jgi:NADH:ubiquinone oxidoreductase subunit 3 (subunit A)
MYGQDLLIISVFALISGAVPVIILLVSKSLRHLQSPNYVSELNYESGEEPIGESMDVSNDYLPYFPLFMAFEIVALLVIFWSLGAWEAQTDANYAFVGVVAFASVLSIITTSLIKAKVR